MYNRLSLCSGRGFCYGPAVLGEDALRVAMRNFPTAERLPKDAHCGIMVMQHNEKLHFGKENPRCEN